MNIGIFVTSMNPSSPSQARLQEALFAGLERLGEHRYRFIVFSYDAALGRADSDMFSYHQIVQRDSWTAAALALRSILGRSLLLGWRLLGASGGRLYDYLAGWIKVEPAHYQQMRNLNVRLLWNLNQHELKTPLPYIRTIWEANHRIHSMYPEYSYSRFTFDSLDSGLADSLARASYVIVGTEEGKRQIINMLGVYSKKVRVVPFPTPVLPKLASELIPNKSYIFYPSRFWPHKNHVVVLAAIKILLDKYSLPLHCILSGADQGNLAYVLCYADKLGIRDHVEYVGVVSEEQLVTLYKGAFALVYASAVGPDNLPPLEAMSLGCPVITSEVPGAREQYGDAALFFDPMNEQELAERIKELLENHSLREQLIHKGQDRAARWTVEDYAKAILSVLDEFARVARAWEKSDSVFT